MSSRLIRYLAGLLIMLPVVFHSLNLIDLRPLRELEYKFYDARLRLTAPHGVDPRVVIIDIDEKSLARLGQWPWNRDVLARLVESLFEKYRVEVLGLDMVFTEPDEDVTLTELKQTYSGRDLSDRPELEKIVNKPSRDSVFGTTLKKYDVVMGYVFGLDQALRSTGVLPPPLFDSQSGIVDKSSAPEMFRFTSNLVSLQEGKDGGFFSLFNDTDSDGIIRRLPLLTRFQGELYPALSLQVAARYMGNTIEPVIAPGREDIALAALEGLDFGGYSVTMDPRSAVYVPFRGSRNAFRYISASDVIEQSVERPEELSGAVALLGISAAGLGDNRATPMHNVFPGVEIHANLVAGLMDGEFKQRPQWANGIERIVLVLAGLLLVFWLPSLRALGMTLLTGSIVLSYIAAILLVWQQLDFILLLAPLVLTALLIYLINLIAGYLLQTRQRLQLRKSFGLYLPPETIENMQGQSMDSLLRSEKKQMTVLFTDVRGFTSISENMAPENISELMNRLLTPMTEIVHRHGGAIDKYMGDAMMAFWGAPVGDDKHATNSVVAALDMLDALKPLNDEFNRRGWPEINIGIGINTGPMNVGNMGSAFRMAYTVLGDAVNLGSRLVGLTKQYGVSLLLSESTAEQCRGLVLSELDLVRAKGRKEPVRIYTALGCDGDVSPNLLQQKEYFARALACYRLQNWPGALNLLNRLYNEHNAALYRIYIERIRFFATNPPGKDWDGVFEFQLK